MSKTTLQFFRTPQNLSDIITERPTSIQTVRQALLRATHEAEIKLNDLERSFYGGQHELTNIRDMVKHCRVLMPVFKISNWNATDQTAAMWSKVVDPASSEDFEEIMNHIRELHTFDQKLREFIPGRFQVIVDDINTVVRHIKKYLLSFYDGKEAPYLETCHHYECRKKEFEEAIQNHIQNIRDMGNAYRSTEGLLTTHFGLHVNEIARSCDCGRILILLLFPQAMQNARNAIKGVLKWLETDEEYVDFLRADLNTLENKREEVSQKLNALKEACWTLDTRIQNIHREAMEIKCDLNKLTHHEKKLNSTVDELTEQLKVIDMDIEVKENQRDRLIERIKEQDFKWEDEESVQERLADAYQTISDMRYEVPAIKKRIEAVKSKMGVIVKKRKLWDEKKTCIRRMQSELTSTRGNTVMVEVDLNRIDSAISVIRNVITKKCSSDLAKKIYYQMPIRIRNARKAPEPKKSQDPSLPKVKAFDSLDRACTIVSQLISHDWSRLYRSLPFYPHRGQANLDTDVSNLIQVNYRTNDVTMARESLQLWRRQHTLASIPELKRALLQVNRKDIVEHLNRVKPQQRKEPVDSKAKKEKLLRRRAIRRVFTPTITSGRAADQSVRAVAAAAAEAQKRLDELILPKITA